METVVSASDGDDGKKNRTYSLYAYYGNYDEEEGRILSGCNWINLYTSSEHKEIVLLKNVMTAIHSCAKHLNGIPPKIYYECIPSDGCAYIYATFEEIAFDSVIPGDGQRLMVNAHTFAWFDGKISTLPSWSSSVTTVKRTVDELIKHIHDMFIEPFLNISDTHRFGLQVMKRYIYTVLNTKKLAVTHRLMEHINSIIKQRTEAKRSLSNNNDDNEKKKRDRKDYSVDADPALSIYERKRRKRGRK